MNRRSRVLAGAGIIFLTAAIPGFTASGSELSWGEQKLLETFSALEAGTMAPPEARDFCRRYLNAMPYAKVEPLRQIAAGLFEVHHSIASETLCAALVESSLAGEVTTTQIERIAEDGDEREQVYELGRVLRFVYFANKRNATL